MFDQWRLLMAERLMGWAMQITPYRGEGKYLIDHLYVYFHNMSIRIKKETKS